MTSIERILETNGPLMSGKLSEALAKMDKIPVNTASQKVSRSNKIKKIKGFFVSNQSLCYLEEHFKDGELYDALSSSMFSYGRKYWYCLNAIKMHGGIIESKFLECYTNYPIEPLKSHIPFKEVMQKFVSEGVLIFNDSQYRFAPKFSPLGTSNLLNRTIEVIKEDILNHFHSMFKNMGMISYNTGETFAEFGKFRWSFKGASYLRGLVSNKNPGFILADILFGKEIYKEDVIFFIEKLNHIQSYKNAPRLIPFLIVDDLHPEALELLKKNGIAIGLVRELFGNKYAQALKELVSVLNNAGASLKSEPDKYLKLIKELKIFNETLVFNIRGTLFEYFVGHIHSRDCKSIDLGRELFENDGKHEIDVFAIYSNKVVFVECKATNGKIDLDKIDKWIHNKIPAFRTWLLKQETLKNLEIEFEYWATGGFTDEALEKLKKLEKSASKFKSSYFDPVRIREKTIRMKSKNMKEVLDNYFLKSNV